jgi:septum formation protein
MPSRSIVLVSASPRRADLLRHAGLEFTVRPSEVDETPFPGEAPGVLAERLARAKVLALPAPPFPALAIGADTVVAVADSVLGKPRDRAEAREMLRRLSGRVHEVTTAMALRTLPEETIVCERVVSRVTFARLSDREIDWYAETGEGMDKAGAYALQGIGALFIESIAGSYTNVIGLPLERLYPHLRLHDVLPAPPARS